MGHEQRASRSWQSRAVDSVVLPVCMTVGSYLGHALYRRMGGEALDMSSWWESLPYLVIMGYPLLWAWIWIPWFVQWSRRR